MDFSTLPAGIGDACADAFDRKVDRGTYQHLPGRVR
jgi:hypothetical protein